MLPHLNGVPTVIVHNYLETFHDFLTRSGKRADLWNRRFNGDHTLFWLGQSKLVITSSTIQNQDYLRAKWGYEETQAHIPSEPTYQLCIDILNDPELINKIISYAGAEKTIQLIPYATTPEFYKLAEGLRKQGGLDVITPESPQPEKSWLIRYIDSKVGFRTLVSHWLSGDNFLPFGFVRNNADGVCEAASWFKQQQKGCVIKADIGGSGVGNIFLSAAILSGLEDVRSELKKNPFMDNGLFVVEEFIETTHLLSPSLELFVPPSETGEPFITYLADQHFEESGRFAGVVICRGLEQASWQPTLSKNGMNIAKRLQELGYVGHFDIDTIVDDNGEIYFVEINARRTGGTIAHEFCQHLFGDDYAQEYSIISQNKASSGAVRSFDELKKTIKDLEFNPNSGGSGVIVTLTSMLSMGYFGYMVVARNLSEAKAIRKSLLERF